MWKSTVAFPVTEDAATFLLWPLYLLGKHWVTFSSGLHFSLTWGLPFFRLFGVKVAHHKFVHRRGENQTPAPDRHEPLWFIFAAQPSPWGLNSFHHFLVLIYFALINKQHFSDLRIQLATDLHIHRKRKKEEDQEGCGLFWDETHLVSLQCCGSNSTFPEALLCFHTVLLRFFQKTCMLLRIEIIFFPLSSQSKADHCRVASSIELVQE